MAAVFDFPAILEAVRRLFGEKEGQSQEQKTSDPPASQSPSGPTREQGNQTNNPGYHNDTGLRDNWE